MKKWFVCCLAALLLCAPALAEISFVPPAGYAPAEDAGYFAAAQSDVGADFDGEARVFAADGKSISLVMLKSDAASSEQAARNLVQEYAEYIDGFENVQPTAVEAGGRTFQRLDFSVDGETVSQMVYADGENLCLFSFAGMDDSEILAALAGFTPSDETAE